MYFMQSKPFRLALEKKFLVCLTWGAPEIINTSPGKPMRCRGVHHGGS